MDAFNVELKLLLGKSVARCRAKIIYMMIHFNEIKWKSMIFRTLKFNSISNNDLIAIECSSGGRIKMKTSMCYPVIELVEH